MEKPAISNLIKDNDGDDDDDDDDDDHNYNIATIVHHRCYHYNKILNDQSFPPLTSVKVFSILFPIHSLRCWLGEFMWKSTASSAADNFLYSHDLAAWFRGDIVKRN